MSSANYVQKTERTLNERCVEHASRDQNNVVKNHLEQCAEVQFLLNVTNLLPPLFLDDNNNTEGTENRNWHINLVIDNTKIIDCFKSFIILLFIEAIKINEIKPTLNTGLKASKELQLFQDVLRHHALISCNLFQRCMLIDIDLLEVSNSHITAVIFY